MRAQPPPVATYRLQLRPGFGFDDAAAVVPYITDLGASHLYLSPVFEAVPGSTHGYDQTDPTKLRAELGGDAGFERLVNLAHSRQLGIVLDFVPNHVAAHHANPRWWDVLKHGRGSTSAPWFDIAWDEAGGKLVLPILGEPIDRAIASGALRLDRSGDEPTLRLHDRLLPVAPGSDLSQPLEKLLDSQHYLPLPWREGLPRLNLRRFFDIADLAGVNIELPAVFDEFHRGLFALVERGWIDAVRLDHIDGLRDPLAYLRRLRSALDDRAPRGVRVSVIVEKILAPDESLPAAWPVEGTTGYEFLGAATLLAVEAAGFRHIASHAAALGAGIEDHAALRVRCKREIALGPLRPELDRLVSSFLDLLTAAGADATGEQVRDALVAVSAHLPVYRTYTDASGVSAEDAATIAAALASARRDGASGALDSLGRALLLERPFNIAPLREEAIARIQSWQQFTGPLAAKGVEDTALYRDASFPALADVGSEPALRDAAAQLRRVFSARETPCSFGLNTASTHDTKRGEDTRLRMAALSRIAGEWTALLDPWRGKHAALRTEDAPAPSDELLLYHSMAALYEEHTLPGIAERLKAYATKAAREAKSRSSWLAPDESYEAALHRWIETLLLRREGAAFRRNLDDLAPRLAALAGPESLALVALKTLAPGVPDFYQGAELLDLSLVDPDNRRPVDFDHRRGLLGELRDAWRSDPAAASTDALSPPSSDRAKLFVAWRSLACRRWLLEGRGAWKLEELVIGAGSRRWRTRCGDRVCRVEMSGADGVDSAPGGGEPDQLGGGAAWISVRLEGAGELI